MKLRALLIAVISVLVIAWLALLVSDGRLLLSETKVEPGQDFVVPEWGNVGKAGQASLVCKYFTGRSTVMRVFWYSPNNILGKDACPLLFRDQAL